MSQNRSLLSDLADIIKEEYYSGTHLIDSFHVIRNFAKMSQNRSLLSDLADIIKEESPHKYGLMIEQFT